MGNNNCLEDTLRKCKYRKLIYEEERDNRIALTYRAWQIIIIIYIFGYSLIYEKGYQKVKNGDMHTSTKLKGVIVTTKYDFENEDTENNEMYHRVWDSSEYGGTPSENSDNFFVATNVIITPNQTMGFCGEDPTSKNAVCENDDNCLTDDEEDYVYLEHGAKTGKCIHGRGGKRVCEIYAWCPVEHERFAMDGGVALLEAAENFTVFIKSEVNFHYFGNYKRNNIKGDPHKTHLKHCRYDKKNDPLCPIFTIKNLIKMAKDEDFHRMCHWGGVLTISIKWDCDLDWNFIEYCIPKYEVRRIDNYDENPSKGYSFRKAYHYDLHRRTLIKYHGIKFIIEGTAVGRKFSFMKTVTNIAIGLALLRTANHVANFALWVKAQTKGTKNSDQPESQEMTNGRTEAPV